MSVFETLGTVTPLTGGVPPSVAAVQPSLTDQEQEPSVVAPKPESVFTGIGTVTQGPVQAPIQQTSTQGLEQHFTGSFHEASTIQEALKAAWQGSATGLMARGGKAPEVEIGKNTPWLAQQVGAFAQMGADLPLMIGAGTAGAAAGSELPVIGNVAGAMAGFAVPAAIRSYYMEAIKNGEVTSTDQAIQRVSAIGWEAAKGAIEGLALGKVGILMGTRTLVAAGIPTVSAEKLVDGTFAKLAADEGRALVASGIPADLAGKEAATRAMEQLGLNPVQMATVGKALNMPMAGLSKMAAEVGTLTTTSAFLEGRMPEPSEFLNTAILLGGFHYGMKGGGKLVDKLQNVYAKTGVRPSELLEDIKNNPNMLLDISDATAEVRAKERATLADVIKRDDLIKSATDKAYRGETPTAEEAEAEKMGALDVSSGSPELQRAVEILKIPEDQRTSAETYFLDTMEKGDYGTTIDKNDIRVLAPSGTVTEAAKIKLAALEEKAATTRAETKPDLTEAQQAAMEEAQARHDSMVEMYKRNYANDPLELGKRLKGLGMKLSAEKRNITGELTPKEQALKDKREAGNYIGKEVVVDGVEGKVVSNPFGKVKVEFADGTTKTVAKELVSAKPKEAPAEVPAEPHVGLSDKEREEYEFLKANKDNPDALADRYGVGITDVTARGTLPRQVQQSNAYQTMLAQATEAMKDLKNLPKDYADSTARVYYAMYDAMARRFTKDGTPMTADDVFRMHQMMITGEGAGTLNQKAGETAFKPVDTESPEFKRWFGKSKVVGEDGKPLVVYHGTSADFDAFSHDAMYSGEGASQTGSGFYFTTSKESASNYARMNESGGRVLPVHLSLENPLHIDFLTGEVAGADIVLTKAMVKKIIMRVPNIRNIDESPLMNFGDIAYEGFDSVLKQAVDAYAGGSNLAALRNDFFDRDHSGWLEALAKATGHDSAVTVTMNGDTHYVAWKPEQIKSAISNTGEFSRTNPSILYQGNAVPPAPTFFSALARHIAASNTKAAPAEGWKAQIKGAIAKGTVKATEVEATGLNDWLDMQGKGKVTKEQVQAFLDQNGVQVRDVTLGETRDLAALGKAETEARTTAQNSYNKLAEATNATQLQAANMRHWLYDIANKTEGLEDSRQKLEELVNREGAQEEYTQAIADEQRWIASKQEQDKARGKDTKFASYQLPGGENYKELLLTLPEVKTSKSFEQWTRENYDGSDNSHTRQLYAMQQESGRNFNSPHFDQPNILAHVRFNSRVDAQGKRVLFLEELQSDWAQKGRKEGFRNEKVLADNATRYENLKNANEELRAAWDSGDSERLSRARIEAARAQEAVDSANASGNTAYAEFGRIPSAPFIGKTEAWTALALKRMIRYASENSFDKIAWTTGEQQAARYDLSKQIKEIDYIKRGDKYEIAFTDNNGGGHNPGTFSAAELPDVVGKEVAQKIVNGEGKSYRGRESRTLEGLDLKVGGEGMKGYYDKIIPSTVKDILRKLDVSQHAFGKESESSQVIRDSSLVDAHAISDLALSQSFRDQGFKNLSGEEKRLVSSHMLGLGKDSQVLQSVISAIPVDVVNVLKARQLTPEMFFHDPAMLIDNGAIPLRSDVSVGGDVASALVEAVARASAKDAQALGPVGSSVKGRPTVSADTRDSLHGVSTISIAGLGEQPGFSITPAMRENAMSGQPLFQQNRGFYEPASRTVGFLQAADPSTAIHEGFHFFFDFMAQVAKEPNAPAELKADVLKMLDYLGIKGGLEEWDKLGSSVRGTEEFAKWEQAHEQMARDGERFLITGEFPQTGLRSVLSKFKDWMIEVYKSITNMGVKLDPEIHDIFQRMIGTDDATGIPKEYTPLVMKELGDKIIPGFKAEQVSIQPFPDEPRIAGDIPLGKYVNLNYVNDSLAVKALMDKISEVYTQEIQARRGGTEGVKSWEDANSEAAKFFNDMMNNGNVRDLQVMLQKTSKTSIDIELRVKNLLMKAAVRDTVRTRDILMDKWDKGIEVSLQEQLDYLRSIERASMIQSELLGVRAEVGRALNQMKDRSTGHGEEQFFDPNGAVRLGQPGMDDPEIQRQFNELMDIYRAKYGKDFTVKQLAQMHKAQKTLKGNLDFNEAFTESTTFDKFFEAWRAGLLSGPVTHTANFVGNIANDVMRAPIDYIASWFGRARGAEVGVGELSRQDSGEAMARIGGMFSGLNEAIKVFAETYTTGGLTGKTETYQPAIKGQVGEWIRIPYKLMGAADAMTQYMYRRGELATMAMRTALGEGLNPSTAEFANRVKYLKENPTQSMSEEAVTQALRMAFNKDLGEGGQKLQAFINAFPMMKIIAPFVRTPLNILEEMLRVSAFAPLMKSWREDFNTPGIRSDRAKAEWALGMGLMSATALMAMSGVISGNGPVDQNKKRTMQAAGWQPYSIKIGDTWYEYQRIQPFGTMMGMAADLAEVWDHIGKDDQDKIPKMLGVAFANSVTNQTFLQGVTSALNAVSDPGKSMPNWAKSFAGSLVPNVIGAPTVMADPVARQVDSMLQAVMAKIPGLRQQLRPKLDYLGEPIKGPERPGWIFPSRESTESTDKVRTEAARLQVGTPADMKKLHLGTGSGKIGDVKLDPEESQRYDEAAGKMTYSVMDKIVNQPGWGKIPDPIKINIFHNVIIGAHKYAAAVTFPDAKRQELLGQIIGKMEMNMNAPGATQ